MYGVPLLLSGEMYALLSPFVRAFCRRLDCVKVSGRETPITLYTFDMQQRGMDAVCRGEQMQAGMVSTALGALDEVKEERRERDDSMVTITATSAPHSAAPKLSLSTTATTLPTTSSATLPAPSNYASSLRSQFTAIPSQPLAPHHYVRSLSAACAAAAHPVRLLRLARCGHRVVHRRPVECGAKVLGACTGDNDQCE